MSKSNQKKDTVVVLKQRQTVTASGGGPKVARTQHAVKEFKANLTDRGITMKYKIYPVGGHMSIFEKSNTNIFIPTISNLAV